MRTPTEYRAQVADASRRTVANSPSSSPSPYAGLVRIALPCVTTALLFAVIIFAILLPAMKQSLLDRKREMIRALTESAWSALAHYQAREQSGELSREQAQALVCERIRKLRYGPDMKNYFWIHDTELNLIVQPFKPEIEGLNLRDCTHVKGADIYYNAVQQSLASGQGHFDYVWQWKDDPSLVVPKMSYIKVFKPWNWVVGTGLYTEDVRQEIAGLTGRLAAWSAAGLVVVLALLTFVFRQNLASEKGRRQAELGLREANAWLRQIIDASPFGLVVLDEECTCRIWSPAAERLFGWSSDQVIGLRLPFAELPGADASWEELRQRLTQGDASGYEMCLTTSEQTPLDVSLWSATVRGVKEQANGRLLALEVITQRKQAERSLRESEAKLQAIFNAVQTGILVLDRDSQEILTINGTALRMIGRDECDVVGAYRNEFVRQTIRPVEERKSGSDASELTLIDGDDRSVPILSHTVPLDISGRQVVIESIVDISEMKRAESELKQRVEEISEAKRRMEVLVTNMAGRERRMVELKQEVNDLLAASGREPKYQAPQEAAALSAISSGVGNR